MRFQAPEQEKRVCERIQTAIKNEALKIQYAPATDLFTKSKYIPDLVITKENNIIAILEVKGGHFFDSTSQISLMYKQIKDRLSVDFKDKLFVITDGERFLFEDVNGSDIIMFFDTFISFLLNTISLKYKRVNKKDNAIIINYLCDLINNSDLKNKTALIECLLNRLPDDAFEENGVSVRFTDQLFENQFFLKLLGVVNDGELCRYTTLDSLFLLLKKKKQNMCSLVCMNDKGELTYVTEKIKLPYLTIPDDPNNCFILSLLPINHDDELTFWRLYGDDASGACIKYEIKKGINSSTYPGFYLAHVSYERDKGCHPELSLIQKMVSKGTPTGKHFSFWNWHIWMHFFKSMHFSIEDEIRLLYIPPKGAKPKHEWINNEKNKIVSKMLLFGIDPAERVKIVFPLSITSAKIGPKNLDPDVATQYNYMAKRQIKSVKSIELSERIDIYR